MKRRRRKAAKEPAEAAEHEPGSAEHAPPTEAEDPGPVLPPETSGAEAGEQEVPDENAPPQVPVETLLADAQGRFLRAKADLENYRKRVQREMSELRIHMKTATIEEFFPVFDHFRMALDHAGEDADVKTLKQGMDMIHVEFKRTLEALGVEVFDATGETFDPTCHEAIAQEPSDDTPEGHVLRQWKCGFRMGERVVRAATVVVSSGPA